MFKYLFFLVLCNQISYGIQQPHTKNEFKVAEILERFDYTKPSTTTDVAHFINTACMYIQLGHFVNLPPCYNDTITKPIATHLLLQAVSSETDHIKDYVTLLLSLGADPLGTQKITLIQTGRAKHIGGLQTGITLYNLPDIYTEQCETPLGLAIRRRNVDAVEAILEERPDLVQEQIHSPPNGKTYADLCTWLMENAQETEELKQIHKRIQQALKKNEQEE